MSVGLLFQLDRYYSWIDEAQDPIHPDEVAALIDSPVTELAVPVEADTRRPWLVTLVAAAAVLVLIGGVILLIRPGDGSSPVATQSPPMTAAPTTEATPPTTEATPPTTVAVIGTDVICTDVGFHEVTMELLGEEGFATTCDVLIMRSATSEDLVPSSALVADGTGGSSVPRLFLKVSEELSWQREFPEPLSGEGFGTPGSFDLTTWNWPCHGGTVEGSPAPWDGLLVLTLDDDVISFLWHFDYYLAEGVRENFTISGETPVEWTVLPGGERTTEVSGEFSVAWFQNLGSETVHLYEPFVGSPRPFHFQLTVTPKPDLAAPEEPPVLDSISAAAAESAEAWNAVVTQFGVENLTLEDGTTEGNGLDTVWELSTEFASAHVAHIVFHNQYGEFFEIGFWLDSGSDTEAGRSWLHDATRVLIRLWEPTLTDTELEDLASRLVTPEEFGYEEVGNTVFMSGVLSDTERYLLATPMS